MVPLMAGLFTYIFSSAARNLGLSATKVSDTTLAWTWEDTENKERAKKKGGISGIKE